MNYIQSLSIIFILNWFKYFDQKIRHILAVRAGKGFNIIFSNEDMNEFIKIIKSLKYSGISIDGVTGTIKNKIKRQKSGFLGALLAPLAASRVQPVISSVVKGISGRGVRREGRGYMNKNF